MPPIDISFKANIIRKNFKKHIKIYVIIHFLLANVFQSNKFYKNIKNKNKKLTRPALKAMLGLFV